MITSPLTALTLAVAFAFAGATTASADSGYTLTILPTLGGCCSQAADVNSAGLVVGNSHPADAGFNAFLWDGANMTPLPALVPGFGTAVAINDGGLVAGWSSAAYDGFSNPARATLWTNGQPTQLATLQPTGSTFAEGMNGAGQIVGRARLGEVNRAVFWPTPAQIVALPDLGGASNSANDLDGSGRAVGASQLASGDVHAILWTGIGAAAQLVDINPFGASRSIASAINDNGAIAGTATYPGQPGRHAVVWTADGTVATDIHNLPSFTTSAALDINNARQAVGVMQFVSDVHPFLYSGGVMTDLNDLLPPGSSWTLWTAAAINDAGTIVGTAISGSTTERGFILTPNTPAGTGVVAQPVDSATSSAPVTLTFATVTAGGGTSLTIGNSGPNPPAGFTLGDPSVYYELATSASFTGSIEICVDSTGIAFGGLPTLWHYQGGSWVNVTTSVNGSIVCGSVASLSPFALFAAPPAPVYRLCLLYDSDKAVKEGSTVPIKLQLCDADGVNLSSADLPLHAQGVELVSTDAPGPLEDSGNANPDGNFRYDATLGGTGGYIYNLSTKGLGTGTYALEFTAGSEPHLYRVQFQVR